MASMKYEFKSKWFDKATPERQMEISQLNSLKDQVLQVAKNKLHEVRTEAWKILDKLYGQPKEIS